MLTKTPKFGLRMKRSTIGMALFGLMAATGLLIFLRALLWNGDAQPTSPFAVDGIVPTAIVILGGGVTPEGTVPEHTRQRIKVALEVYQELSKQALFFTLSGGTPHKPNPVDAKGFPVWEATAAAKALLEAGIPADRILEESFSLDTIGNAYYLRNVHMEPSGLRSMVVITNDWHLPRTKAIFDFVFALPTTGGARSLYDINYRAASAGISDDHLLGVRKEKEAAALASFLAKVAPEIHSMQELHGWLFLQHSAYASSRLVRKESGDSVASAELLKTY